MTLCNIKWTKSLSNIIFLRRKFFTCKMEEHDDLLDHINKVKTLADEIMCLEVPVREQNIGMTLLESLPASYEYLITVLETMSIKDVIMGYGMARLMHEMSKRNEKDPQGKDVAMALRQNNAGHSPLR